jgi:hypothetical protein
MITCGCGRTVTDFYSRMRGECTECYEKRTPAKETPTYREPAAASDPPAEGDTDPVTKRLMDAALPTHGKQHCPKCFRQGFFKKMALCCELHGPFGGL